MLGELFSLIGLKFLRELLDKPWFFKMLVGLAFGGAVGLLRDRERVLSTLQRVVTTVLSVLAPVLAVGLLAFLVALPFTGLTPLWGATKSTTPILLSCIVGALILANTVIGDVPEESSRRRALQWAAMALGVALLPLGVIAAISTGLRILQYGLTPDRLWAVVFTGVACAYGAAYVVALARRRSGWANPVRVANLRLALALCGLTFILSTPLFSFSAISTKDQLARLESGRTSPDKFDWSAMRFDFGPAGKAAVEREAKSAARPEIRAAAVAVLKADSRWDVQAQVERASSELALDKRLVILPKKVLLPPDLRHRLTNYDACDSTGICAVIYTPGAGEVFGARNWSPAFTGDGNAAVATVGRAKFITLGENIGTQTFRLTRTAKGWFDVEEPLARAATLADEKTRTVDAQAEQLRQYDAIRSGDVEIREVRRRQIFVGGKPVGNAFDDAGEK